MVLNDARVCSSILLRYLYNQIIEFLLLILVRRTLHLGLNEEERAEVLGAGQN